MLLGGRVTIVLILETGGPGVEDYGADDNALKTPFAAHCATWVLSAQDTTR